MQKVRFGDVVKRVNIYVDRFNTDRLYYVGKGGSIEPEALEIKPQAKIKGATIGFKFHFGFDPGHILFMSRCFDQHKAATATFRGVCSDSTYVVETRDENILLQSYLQLVMQSNDFWNWCEEHKSGGVNFLINYGTLETYEFSLPSLEEQKILADKLWAAYRVKESYRQLLATTDDMLIAQFHHMFGNVDNPKVKVCRLGDICDVERGGSPRPISAFITNNDDGVNWIKIGDAESDSMYINKTEEKIIQEGIKMSRMVHKGDLLLSNSMSFGHPYILNIDGCIHDGWLVLHLNPKIVTPIFLCRYLGLQSTYQQFKKLAAGGVVKNLNKDVVKVLPVIIPTLEEQEKFATIATQAEATKASLRQSIDAIDRVIRSLINQ